MPDRDDFPEGAEGEPAYANVFEKFAEENFDGKAVELRTIDQHELKAGFFGKEKSEVGCKGVECVLRKRG